MQTTVERPPVRLSYERLLQILNQIPLKEDSDYVLSFLLANDRKLKAELAKIQQERIFWEEKSRFSKQQLREARQELEVAISDKKKMANQLAALTNLRESLNKKIAWVEEQRRQLAHFLPEQVINDALGQVGTPMVVEEDLL